jgi:hypothetical protein
MDDIDAALKKIVSFLSLSGIISGSFNSSILNFKYAFSRLGAFPFFSRRHTDTMK